MSLSVELVVEPHAVLRIEVSQPASTGDVRAAGHSKKQALPQQSYGSLQIVLTSSWYTNKSP